LSFSLSTYRRGVFPLLTGQVSAFQARWERGAASNQPLTVWSFRLERHDDRGQPLPRVAVEMRGKGFDGTITPGDWIRIDKDWREGTTLHAESVTNLSTNSIVQAKGVGKAIKITQIVFCAVVIAFMVTVFGWVAFEIFMHS
jgi:hypothetical protein